MMKLIASQIAIIICFISFSQEPEKALAAFKKKFPSEKIYIHYDRDHYNPGETIWFKAYVYSDGLPGTVSHNIYLQLLNGAGQVIDKKIYPVAGATANGSITLPKSLPAGSYYIRATTPTMLNQAEEFIYRRNIPIYSAGQVTGTENIDRAPYTVEFFPESGNLVDGINSVVAVRIKDKWGYPASLSGVVRSNKGTIMASFKTNNYGIDRIQFTSAIGHSYSGEIEVEQNKFVYPFPAVQAGGINVSITDEQGSKVFLLTRGEVKRNDYQTVLLVVQLNNEVIYLNEIPFEDYLSVKGRLITKELSPGILQFTVFDVKGNVIAERLTFHHNEGHLLKPQLDVETKSFDSRGFNQFKLRFPEGVKGIFSVSVTDADLPTINDKENICSRLLLTGDLKDHVFNAADYFNNSDHYREQSLENFLLTQTWSRFNWSQLLKNQLPAVKYKDHYLRTLTGIVSGEKAGEKIQAGTLNLFLEGGDSVYQNYNLPVSKGGKFVLDSLLFRGEGRVQYAYSEGKKSKKVSIALDKTEIDSIAAVIPGLWAQIRNVTPGRDPVMNAWTPVAYQPVPAIVKSDSGKVAEKDQNDNSNANVKDQANMKYANGVWRSGGRVIYEETMKAPTTTNVLEYVLQSVHYIKVLNGYLTNTRTYGAGGGDWQVGVFLDENPISLSQSQPLQMRDVGLIKFYEAGFVGVGSMYPGGAVAIYRTKDNNGITTSAELPSVPYSGYSIYTDFSKSAEAKPPSGGEDNRKLLYWEPSLYVDAERNTYILNFQNSDKVKKFKVVVEGFDASGKLLYFEKIIQ